MPGTSMLASRSLASPPRARAPRPAAAGRSASAPTVARHSPLARLAAVGALAASLAAAAGVLPAPAAAQDLAAFAARTTVHVLPNGWTFILVRRPVAPVFSFSTVADVGSVQEVTGITGLAHMFEHMAFKGTDRIGTRDPAGEKRAMDAAEVAYQAYQRARLAPHPDDRQVAALFADFKRLEAAADRFVVKSELDEILARAGAVGVNASTGADETEYYYSLPANQVELFADVESARFSHPVFREFYEERDVVQEERRMRVDGDPMGRLTELLVETAFAAHPYHHPTIGYMSDLEAITRTDAEAFFRDHYVPAAMVTAIVGDVDPRRLIPLLDERFGRIPARPPAPPLRTVEPPQAAAKTVTLADPAQPQLLVAYHRPAVTHPDDAVFEAIDDVLTGGRTSRLYRALVRDQQLAIEVESFSGLPGEKYPNLWTLVAEPAAGIPAERLLAAIDLQLERLAHEDVTDAELAKFRTRARASLLRSLGSNQGLASALAHYQTLYGDWRELFRELDRFERVTKADVRRVANAALATGNRTVAILATQSPSAAATPEAEPEAVDEPATPPGPVPPPSQPPPTQPRPTQPPPTQP
ncbi:MAG TPA: pitrilysin family protein, partial [Thermoanaerobaculia bacterium]|nr:pitrilysin family protein [Thermoanaerobaculia bacterium]